MTSIINSSGCTVSLVPFDRAGNLPPLSKGFMRVVIGRGWVVDEEVCCRVQDDKHLTPGVVEKS